MGLYFFMGCNLSLLKSIQSFNKYIEDDIRLNTINVLRQDDNTSKLNLKDSKGTTRTSRFFDQCLGRIAINKGVIVSKMNIYKLIVFLFYNYISSKRKLLQLIIL